MISALEAKYKIGVLDFRVVSLFGRTEESPMHSWCVLNINHDPRRLRGEFRLSTNSLPAYREEGKNREEGIDCSDRSDEQFSGGNWLRFASGLLLLGLGRGCVCWVAHIDFDASRRILWGRLCIVWFVLLVIGFTFVLSIY